MACDDYNRLHPTAEQKTPWITSQLSGHTGVIVAATDYIRNYAEQIRGWLPEGSTYTTLGTDGFGRSDTRQNLRSFFNVDANHIVLATLKKLADKGEIGVEVVQQAIELFEIDADSPPAWQPQPHFDYFPDAPAVSVSANPHPVPELIDEDK